MFTLGVNLRDLLPKKSVDLRNLSGRSIAIDAANALHQFLAVIRQPDGTPLKDSIGRITSHLSGLLYRTSKLVEMEIKPVYVFDGIPPSLKEVEIKRRTKIKAEAVIKYKRALKEGKLKEARTYAQATSRLEHYMIEDAIRLLSHLGIPWVQAPSEGEAQAAYLTRRGDTAFCASQDYDSLLFGAPRLVRNVTISGRRKLPRKSVYINVIPEMVDLNKVLTELDITHEQLIDVGILVGTDFNPNGVKGIGPKTAVKLIKEHGNLERLLPNLKETDFPVEPRKIREIFLHPKVTDNYRLKWKDPDVEGVINFLCTERAFSEERVRRALEKINKTKKKTKGKVTLETFFS